VPGLRSGFVAGDAALIKPFLLYRTYHGSAMSPIVQAASVAAWNDEQHVVDNRAMYREKFAKVTPMLSAVMDVALPDAGFYSVGRNSRSLQRLRHRVLARAARSLQCRGVAGQLPGTRCAGAQPRRRQNPHGAGGRNRRMRRGGRAHRPVHPIQSSLKKPFS
jgi:histidinol-phosphate/aromatic aminotransferase/cobyric acid decarboxylase-like protein